STFRSPGSCHRVSSMRWPRWPVRWASNTSPAGRSFAPATTRMKWFTSMQVPVVLPDLGAAPVTLSLWYADLGERVFEGDRLVEVLVGGATFDVSAPVTGRLAEKSVRPDQMVQPGQVLGLIHVDQQNEVTGPQG